MYKVFLDVGAHDGESLTEAMEPRWAFDRIYCFEPVSACLQRLEVLAADDQRVEIVPAGLWSTTCSMTVFGAGSLAGSLDQSWATTSTFGSSDSEECAFLDASRWFRDNITPEDLVWAKFNIEGAETEVLVDLARSGELEKIRHLVIHFDGERMGRLADGRSLRATLARSDTIWSEAGSVMFGRTPGAKLASWLNYTHGRNLAFRRAQAEHRVRAWVWKQRRRFRRRNPPRTIDLRVC